MVVVKLVNLSRAVNELQLVIPKVTTACTTYSLHATLISFVYLNNPLSPLSSLQWTPRERHHGFRKYRKISFWPSPNVALSQTRKKNYLTPFSHLKRLSCSICHHSLSQSNLFRLCYISRKKLLQLPTETDSIGQNG